MSNQNTRNSLRFTPTETMAAYLNDRNEELLDAVVTAAAVVARADGRITPVERGLLLDFMDRNGFLSVFTCSEILDAFERRVRQFDEHGGAEAAVDDLGRLAGRSPSRLIIGAGKRVAAADGHLHPRELHVLQRIRRALAAPPAPNLDRTGGEA
jgi:tellurite resistance protein TerB